jgi:hypothetical protein
LYDEDDSADDDEDKNKGFCPSYLEMSTEKIPEKKVGRTERPTCDTWLIVRDSSSSETLVFDPGEA